MYGAKYSHPSIYTMTDYSTAMTGYANIAAAFPKCNNSFYIHNIVMAQDSGLNNNWYMSSAYLKNNDTGTYKTKFAQMYAYNSAGTLISANDPKTNFISSGADVNFDLPTFTYTSPYTNADVTNIIVRVTGTLLNGASETLLAYRSFVPAIGPISDPPVPCFTAGSRILTPDGYIPVESLRTGDHVLTADLRSVPAKIYSRTVRTTRENAPFLIPANTFAQGSPKYDLRLSPWHAFSVEKGYWMKPFNAAEFNSNIKQYDIGKEIQYYHIECPNYLTDNLVCNGTLVESYSGKQLNGMKGRVYTWCASKQAYIRYAGSTEKSLSIGR